MVDITEKEISYREAVAVGKIYLKKSTIEMIKQNKVEKGDVLTVSKIAAIQVVKKTSELLPLCHPIPITHVDVNMEIYDNFIEVSVKVKSSGKTGVEMEALSGVAVALLNIWDMVKKYEKNEKGEYPTTLMSDIRVIRKAKK
ncbi:MAG: cyclic pyranopterin monophosphate synthase MoaC [Thermoprotei archaeon]|nr:MAG: cyclic pyranopterin monophosphate synthase MoaC [Thermoprotei archaeon]